jgi:UDP-GlcNAc:undecaprenyl-phosphate GlcNAc-1-phosphate transferase
MTPGIACHSIPTGKLPIDALDASERISDLSYLHLWQQLSVEGWLRALFSLVAVATLAPMLVPVAVRLGLVDHPGGRKDHAVPTPVHGGLVILLAMIASSVLFHDLASSAMIAFFLAGGLLLLVGVMDDLWDLNWKYRIGAQMAAALVMIYMGGVSVQQLSDVVGVQALSLGWLAVPATVFVVVGMINALNMADGVDGLAGGQALVSLLLFLFFALYAGNIATAERLLAVAAAVLGFLVWNIRRPGLPRAMLFLGDAGSMLLGFVIAWTAVRLTQNPEHPVSPVLGPWTIALPLIDCCSLILRRRRHGGSPFKADRDHLHHIFLDAGFTATQVAVGAMIISAILGLAAAVALKLGIYRPVLVLLFFGLIGVHYRFTADRDRAVAIISRLRHHD